MTLTVNTDIKSFYRQLLELLRGIPPLSTLRNRELDLLAVFMYYNWKHRGLDEDIRWRILNDVSTRREMQKEIGMGTDVFNNNISIIRKAGIIDKEGVLIENLRIYPTSNFKLEFNFKVENNG